LDYVLNLIFFKWAARINILSRADLDYLSALGKLEWKDKSDQVIRMGTFYPYGLQHFWLYIYASFIEASEESDADIWRDG
jgi:hypothetical protein